MIIGHGIDLQEISAIQRAVEKRSSFVKRILTPAELDRYAQLNGRRQLEYLAGRWSAKEAFAKAMGTGIGKVSFQDIEILNDEKGAPYVSRPPLAVKVWLSISHSGDFVQASVILEELDETKYS